MRIQQSLCTSRLFRAETKNTGVAISVRSLPLMRCSIPNGFHTCKHLLSPNIPAGITHHINYLINCSHSSFGANFEFHDNSNLQYIGMEKDFNSLEEAAA